MEIIICRHTQTNHNRDRVYSGHINVSLNQTGIQQATTLAEQVTALEGSPIGAVLCSDLARAMYLGKAIADRVEITPLYTPALREVNIGQMAGYTREDTFIRFPDERHRTTNQDFDFSDIGGESAANVITRHHNFLVSSIQQLQYRDIQRVVVVGHGTALRLLFRDTFGLIDTLHEQGEYQIVSM